MSDFPADIPHSHANRIASKDPGDRGSLFITRLDVDTLQVIARSAGESRESRVCVPFRIWQRMIASHCDGKEVT